VFSLEIVNFDGDLEDLDLTSAKAIPALRTALEVRERDGNEAAGRFYEALGIRCFHAVEPLADPEIIEKSLADADLDPARYREAIADQGTWETLVAEHKELVDDHAAFGVPTICIDDCNLAIFGPVISSVPETTEEAVELWRHVSWLTRNPNFAEMKRDRRAANLPEYTAARLRTAAGAEKKS
jgi:hypothetical protein